jgi:hypothetical protein
MPHDDRDKALDFLTRAAVYGIYLLALIAILLTILVIRSCT